MNPFIQHTVSDRVDCRGVGLHSGVEVNLTLCPAPADTGVVFLVGSGAQSTRILACYQNVVSTPLSTTLGVIGGVHVATVEHLMAALSGCGVDNVYVEVNGPEVPIMDGSAAPFVQMIERVGLAEQDARRRILRVLRPIEVREGNSLIRVEPSNDEGMSVFCMIEYENPLIALQKIRINPTGQTFKSEISHARTYGFEHEVDGLRAAGLALGGSLENAVVVSGDRILNKEGLRYRDEFVRHKLLDLMGVLYLAGLPIAGSVYAERPGHAINHQLLCELFARESAFSIDESGVQGTGWTERRLAAIA